MQAAAASAAEMILEGLWAHRRIGRSEERGFYADKPKQQAEQRENPAGRRGGNSTEGKVEGSRLKSLRKRDSVRSVLFSIFCGQSWNL